MNCDVLIVGYNAATKMQGDWWRHWSPGYGYKKSVWHREYLDQRDDNQASKTRKKIDEIVSGLVNCRVVETNIDSRPSTKMSAFPKPITQPFDFLLRAAQPRVVIAHGTKTVEHLQAWKRNGTLIECKHFIYVGKVRTSEIISETKRALQA